MNEESISLRNHLTPAARVDGDTLRTSFVARADASTDGSEGLGEPSPRSAIDERLIRGLRADLDLQAWHARDLQECRIAAMEQVIAESPPEPVAESPPEPITQSPPEPVAILLAKARGLHDRLLPAGTRRRKLSRALFRATFIIATEGFRSLMRKVGNRLKRSLVAPESSHQDTNAQRELQPQSPPTQAAPTDSERTSSDEDQSPPGLVYRPHVTTVRKQGRFALLSSSLGNYYFQEIRDLIATGLSELGNEVVIRTEEEGFLDDVDWNVVVAPHEFFFLGGGEEIRRSRWPENVIIVSTEQPSTKWFALSWECLPRAHAVWDIDFHTSQLLRDRGIACDYLPLGYSPDHVPFGRVEELPMNYGTCFLGEEIRRSRSAGGPLHERPIDIFFVGTHTPRREAFFCRAAPALTDYHAYLPLFDNRSPQLPGKTTHMDTATANGLSQRSKILLNIHHGRDVYFEWHRIVIQGLWHRTLVVSEPCSPSPVFRAGIDYVEASSQQIPRVLQYYLSDACGQHEAQEIADSGHRTLVTECRLSRFLNTLLTHPASSGAVLAHFDRIGSAA